MFGRQLLKREREERESTEKKKRWCDVEERVRGRGEEGVASK